MSGIGCICSAEGMFHHGGMAMNYQKHPRGQQVTFCPHLTLSRRPKLLENTVSFPEITSDQKLYTTTVMANFRDEALQEPLP